MVKDNVGVLILFFLATVAAQIVGACACLVGSARRDPGRHHRPGLHLPDPERGPGHRLTDPRTAQAPTTPPRPVLGAGRRGSSPGRHHDDRIVGSSALAAPRAPAAGRRFRRLVRGAAVQPAHRRGLPGRPRVVRPVLRRPAVPRRDRHRPGRRAAALLGARARSPACSWTGGRGARCWPGRTSPGSRSSARRRRGRGHRAARTRCSTAWCCSACRSTASCSRVCPPRCRTRSPARTSSPPTPSPRPRAPSPSSSGSAPAAGVRPRGRTAGLAGTSRCCLPRALLYGVAGALALRIPRDLLGPDLDRRPPPVARGRALAWSPASSTACATSAPDRRRPRRSASSAAQRYLVGIVTVALVLVFRNDLYPDDEDAAFAGTRPRHPGRRRRIRRRGGRDAGGHRARRAHGRGSSRCWSPAA